MIEYLPAKEITRGRSRLLRHEWYCSKCGTLVHSEPPLPDFLGETEEQQAARVLRITGATESHVCPSIPMEAA